MRKAKEIAGGKCPVCEKTENQVNAGKSRLGTQRCFCEECKKYYPHEPKTREYHEEIRQQATKTYYAGACGQGVCNARDKSDTFTVESVNADLRHYIPILRRRSRCFPRKLETRVLHTALPTINQQPPLSSIPSSVHNRGFDVDFDVIK